MRRLLVGIVTVLFGVAGLAAQARPNFSGRWTMIAEPGAATGVAFGVMFLGTAFIAAQDDQTLTVTPTNHQVHPGESPEQLKAVHNLDGSERKNPLKRANGDSIDRSSKATWDGTKLVITTTTTSGRNESIQTQTWLLDPSGNLVVEASVTYQGNTTTTRAIYKKAS